MMVTGIIATSIGGSLAPVGVVVFMSAGDFRTVDCGTTAPSGTPSCRRIEEDETGKVGGTVMIVGGVVLVAVGSPMLVVGARRQKPDEAFVPRVHVGPQSGALSMKF